MRHFLLVGKVVDAKLPSVIPDIGQGHFDQFVGAIFAYFHRKYLNGLRFWFVVWKADYNWIRIKNNSKQFTNIARCILIEHRRCPTAPMFALCNTVIICLSNWLTSRHSYRLLPATYMQKILMQLCWCQKLFVNIAKYSQICEKLQLSLASFMPWNLWCAHISQL